jgi:hypothetical protein
MSTNKTQLPRFAELAIKFGFATKRMDALSVLLIWSSVIHDAEVQLRKWQVRTTSKLDYALTEIVLTQMTPEELAALKKRIKEQL